MKTFLNEEMKPFHELTDEQMLAIVGAKIAGKCELQMPDRKWVEAGSKNIDFYNIYRTKPQKQLVIPWSVIKPEYKCAEMDKNRRVFVYTQYPDLSTTYWTTSGSTYDITCLTIDTDGIDWETSHVTRPEGV